MMNLKSADRQLIRRVLLDLSHTYNSTYKTGIQRVVRSLHRELPKVARRHRIEYLAVVCKDQGFVRMDSLVQDEKTTRLENLKHDVVSHLPKLYRKTANALCNLVPSKRLRRWFLPEPGHQGIFKLPLKAVSRAFSPPPVSPEPVSLNDTDLLIMPDGYWVMMHVWDAVQRVRQENAKVAVIVHDMICVTHPEFFVPFAKENFSKYLSAVGQHANLVVATTHAGKTQLDHELPSFISENTKIPHITSFRLGADVSHCAGDVRSELEPIFTNQAHPAYLMVSTFEPRKNHKYVLETFEKLWETNPQCTLVFVGAVGWMSDAFIERIRIHPRLNQQLFVFHDLSDAEVNYCYAHSKAVIFPSVIEGFGLPIIESLWHGKKTFVSDNPVHREVGRTDCDYFDLADTDSLRQMIVEYESSKTQPRRFQRRVPVDWQASTEDLLRKCLNGIAADSECCQRIAS